MLTGIPSTKTPTSVPPLGQMPGAGPPLAPQKTLLDFGGSDVGRGVVELGDGRLVVGLRHGGRSRLVVMTAAGAVIGTFDLPIATTPNGIDDVILDRSGRVLVFGDAGAGSADIYVARVLVP